MERKLKEWNEHFNLEGEAVLAKPYGSGHINDTYLLTLNQGGRKVILQRMNHSIFQKPVELMENISGITEHLRRKIIEAGGDPERETLNVVKTKAGLPYYQDPAGDYYRAYYFIEETVSYDQVRTPEDFYQSALAFGNFQRRLADYPAHTLHETIPGFHDTRARFLRFLKVVEQDPAGLAGTVEEEIRFVLERERQAGILMDKQALGELPLRVTHNDTKLNNVLLDIKTGRAICVIDLDTVMPGLAVNDFGDSIRFGASTGAEDEQDLSKISCDLSLYETYARGFIEGCQGSLTRAELQALPLGALLMTYECGLRFLADYLEGDIYFKIHRPKHNLDRARTQFKLVRDMEDKWEQIEGLISRYL